MSDIKFTKMQGLGNDFVILDYDEFIKTQTEASELAKRLCDRNFGVGADGLIIVNPNVEDADIGWIFYNSDGTVAQMCGNGMRCFARYVWDKKLVSKSEFKVKTEAGIIIPKIISDDEVRVNMGTPILATSKIPCSSPKNMNIVYEIDNKKFLLNAISMGNPHCVIFVNENSKEYALKYGAQIETDDLFPEKTNVEFVEILSKNSVKINVWERGCGITLACGTGACATVVAGILNGLLEHAVEAHLPGGVLKIEWNGDKNNPNCDVFMTGNACYSFVGTFVNNC